MKPTLLTLAADCAIAAASLLTDANTPNADVRYLTSSYLRMAGELVECSHITDNLYLYHVQVTVWEGLAYWYKWLCSDDLTAAQEEAHQAIAAAWAALLAEWEARQEAA